MKELTCPRQVCGCFPGLPTSGPRAQSCWVCRTRGLCVGQAGALLSQLPSQSWERPGLRGRGNHFGLGIWRSTHPGQHCYWVGQSFPLAHPCLLPHVCALQYPVNPCQDCLLGPCHFYRFYTFQPSLHRATKKPLWFNQPPSLDTGVRIKTVRTKC